MTKTQRFKFTIPILKTSVKTIKDKNGNEIEEKYVEGIASGTELDLHGDRMAPSAIESMAKSLKQHVINLNDEHDTSWSSEIGDIDQLVVSDKNDLEIKAKLNKMSKADDLWYALTEQNKKLGLSIGGYVKDYEMVKEGEGDDAKWVRLYKKIDLDHIAVTSRPAYPKAWVSNIAKSIKEEDDKKLIKKIENKEKSKRSEKDRQFRELARSIARSIQNVEADLLLELVEKGLTFLSEKQILLIERSLKMTKRNDSLKAKEANKKADAEKSKPEGEKDENLAASETELSTKKKSKTKKVKDVKEEKKSKESKTSKDKVSKKKSKASKGTDEKSKDAGNSKDKKEVVSEKKEDSKDEKSKDKTSKLKKTEKKSDKVEALELTKTVRELSKSLKTVLSGYEKLQEKVEQLESQPASRKTVEVKKTLGDEETEGKSVNQLKKAQNKKIEDIRKEFANDPNMFARVQRVRAEFAKRLANAE